MLKRLLGLVTLASVACVAPAWAQEPRVDVGMLLGWTFSNGVDGDPVTTGDGNVYNRVDPKDSSSGV